MNEPGRLRLPLLQPGQAQKEMFHNEALALLDFAVGAQALSFGLSTPPADPGQGDCWIVGDAPGGAWSDQSGNLACWTEGGWRFLVPVPGLGVELAEDGTRAVYTAQGWRRGEVHGRLFVAGQQVVGPQCDAIANPEGGANVDPEARAALSEILEALRAHGLISTVP